MRVITVDRHNSESNGLRHPYFSTSQANGADAVMPPRLPATTSKPERRL